MDLATPVEISEIFEGGEVRGDDPPKAKRVVVIERDFDFGTRYYHIYASIQARYLRFSEGRICPENAFPRESPLFTTFELPLLPRWCTRQIWIMGCDVAMPIRLRNRLSHVANCAAAGSRCL